MDFSSVLISQRYQAFANEPEFFFQKGADTLTKLLEFQITDQLKEKLLVLSKDYRKLQEEAINNAEIDSVLQLMYEVISYCDTKAKDKIIYNKYDDKRALAMAYVRMDDWIRKLLLFKFSPESLERGSPRNAFDYLLDPENNATILSENHRALVAANLFKKEYSPDSFVEQLKEYFSNLEIRVVNQANYTLLLSGLLYEMEDQWKEEVVALMAADKTDWKDDHIENREGYDYSIVWNSARPVGKEKTLSALTNLIKERGSFNIYYSSLGLVQYKAEVVDFVRDQEELIEKKWKEKNIQGFLENFDEYEDGTKSARILFLVSAFEKIDPIEISSFRFQKPYADPTQHNLVPVISEPDSKIIIMQNDNADNRVFKETTQPLNQILFGPPGTGKTFSTINKALEIIGEKIDGLSRKAIKDLFDVKMDEGQIVFTTFHQSMTYEDFIEGIKPLEPKKEADPVNYKIIDGIFKELAEKAKENENLFSLQDTKVESIPFEAAFDLLKQKVEDALLEEPITIANEMKKGFVVNLSNSFFSITGISGASIKMMNRTGGDRNTMTKPTLKLIFDDPENMEKYLSGGMRTYYKALVEEMHRWGPDIKTLSKTIQSKNYVIIIDEINRGNVSQIFGELITLIEEDKRLGKDEALKLTLPYSKDKFGVPSNLYIIGTMNTADRSVEALDAALRRRFSFEEIPPKYELEELKYEFEGIQVSSILETINKRIEKLLDKDHAIGHSYFILSKDEKPESKIPKAFYKNIIPLLQEYFFGDYSKIGMVLGNGFVRKKEWDKKENSFADFESESSGDYDEKEVYEIINYTRPGTQHSIRIKSENVNKDIEMDFTTAIKLLMKQGIE